MISTTIKENDGMAIVTYHKTDVVKFNENMIILDSGGWRTQTTRSRMNRMSNDFDLGYSVYQKNKKWFVKYKGITLNFYDGITLKR